MTDLSALRFLIVNDDGIDASGLEVMREIAESLSDDVWVVAPDGNQSGAAHRFTFGRELGLERRDERSFAVVGGSPADCVVAGMTHVCRDRRPDVVLSGVNNGQNLGDILNCSGTVAGAREGAFHGAVGIAISQGIDYEHGQQAADWTNSRVYGADVIRAIVGDAPRGQAYFNVNMPYCAPDKVAGLRVVPAQRFSRSPMAYYPSDNPGKFFIAIPETPGPLSPEHDFHQLYHGRAITVTPLLMQQTHMGLVDELAARLSVEVRKP